MKNARTLGCQARSRFPTLLLAASVLLSATAFAGSNTIDVQSITRAVNTRGSTWKAGSNWLTQLSRDQLKKMMGAHDPNLDRAAQFTVKTKTPASSRTVFDWRNNNGVNWVSPVLNQGNCGSCVAFSTVGTLETQYNITSGIPGLNPEFSTQALFMCGGASCDTGWEPDGAAQYLQSTGVPDEACAPYTMGATGVDVACSSICSDSASRSTKISGYTTPTSYGYDVDAVKAALATGPLITTFTVYEDFIAYQSGIYKHVTGDALGGHAVSIVGYDDGNQAWIVRNSWGVNWGEGGFFRISWSDTSGVGADTWGLTLAPASGYVYMENPTHKQFVSGSVALQAKSTIPSSTGLTFNVIDDTGRTERTLSCVSLKDGGDCTQNLDTTTLKEGMHEVYATSTGATGASQHEIFYVLNSKPTMSLSVTGTVDDNGNAVDLTKPISDRVVFDFAIATSPVPFSNLEFDVWNGTTLVYKNTAPIVVSNGMTLGWRTQMVPNGSYTISFTGTIAVPGQTPYTVTTTQVPVTVQNPTSMSLTRR